MSKARQLANLLSNNRDLSDGASTGSEITFTAHGAIEDKKPVIFNADGTVSEAGQSQNIAGTLIDTRPVNALYDNVFPYDYTYAHDIATVGDYIFAVSSITLDGGIRTAKLSVLKHDTNAGTVTQLTSDDTVLDDVLADRGIYTLSIYHIGTQGTSEKFFVFGGKGTGSSYSNAGFWPCGQVFSFDTSTETLTSSAATQISSSSYFARNEVSFYARPFMYANTGSEAYFVSMIPYSADDAYYFSFYVALSGGIVNGDIEYESMSLTSNSPFYDDGVNNKISWGHAAFTFLDPTTVAGTITNRSLRVLHRDGNLFRLGTPTIYGTTITDNVTTTMTTCQNVQHRTNYINYDLTSYATTGYWYLAYEEITTNNLIIAILDPDDQSVVATNTFDEFTGVNFGNSSIGTARGITVDNNGKIHLSFQTDNGADSGKHYATFVFDADEQRIYKEQSVLFDDTIYSGSVNCISDDDNYAYVFYNDSGVLGSFQQRSNSVRAYEAGTGYTSNITDTNIIGFAKEEAANGDQLTVVTKGGILPTTGLTVNTDYYINNNGELSTTSNGRFMRLGLSTTDLLVDVAYGEKKGTVSNNRNVTSDNLGHVTFPDGDYLKFGTDADTSVFHNGYNFYISNTTGDTYLLGDGPTVIQGSTITLETDTGENALYYNGTALYGYYNGSEKVRTDSGGIVVQGYVYATTGIAHSTDTDNRIVFGTDTQTYQTGGTTRMYIDNTGLVDVRGELLADSYNESYAAVVSATNATTVNCEVGNAFSHTLTENTTFTFSNPPASGIAYTMSIEIIQDASASGYTVTWPSSVDWPAATAPTLTATASAKDVFVFTTRDGGTTWYGFTAGQALG